jgi:hypothetical protein
MAAPGAHRRASGVYDLSAGVLSEVHIVQRVLGPPLAEPDRWAAAGLVAR